jgi:hypothetical protein
MTGTARRALAVLLSVFLFDVIASPLLHASTPGELFATPAEAVNALGQATSTTNRAAFQKLFGPDNRWLANPDTVQGTREIDDFNAAFAANNLLVTNADKSVTLIVGTNGWPFPIPLVQTNQGWYFDTDSGREEILDRRIGRNELDVLNVMRAYDDAQREYASRDRDDSKVRKFAQRLASSPGKTDGLYWPLSLNGEVSPLGPMVAEAQTQGYFGKDSTNASGPQPFHGYYFKILTRQGKNAPGGKYDYVINGNMIGGFALVAWPAQYAQSGIMTFIVNQRGEVYQKDLGPNTANIARKMTAYDPDNSWQLSPD